jgi:phosphoribosylformylglycinamidine synthase subunit PurQ / glutaminase
MPRALVIRAAGTNCDGELCRAFRMAGAEADLVHLDRLIAEPSRLERYDLVGFPGGFSYGDDVASGRIFAVKVRERLWAPLRALLERGVPMIGVCNGFQVLVQVGLLPGPAKGEAWPVEAPPRQTTALTDNAGARFIDRWVRVAVEPGTVCVWTRGLDGTGEKAQSSKLEVQTPEIAERVLSAVRANGAAAESHRSSLIAHRSDVMMLPIAHGEGRFVTASPDVMRQMEASGQIALRYIDNVNGSEGAVAGVCDASGLVFGLMPHPDRYLDWNRHPFWTRLPGEVRAGETPGLRMFRNAVEAAARVPA